MFFLKKNLRRKKKPDAIVFNPIPKFFPQFRVILAIIHNMVLISIVGDNVAVLLLRILDDEGIIIVPIRNAAGKASFLQLHQQLDVVRQIFGGTAFLPLKIKNE